MQGKAKGLRWGIAVAAILMVAGPARAGVVHTIDSSLGSSPQADGYHATVNFGSVIIGAANSSTTRFTLKDDGSTPQNNFGVSKTASGNATVSPSGTANLAANGSLNLTVGLDTSAVGNRTGVVTIDSSPPGNDANEVYTLNATVLNHSNASFSATSDMNSLTYDFGTLLQGTTPASAHLGITNLVTTTGFTAGLDLDSVSSSGATGILTTNLSTFSYKAAGTSSVFDVFFDLKTLGSFSAIYTLHLSDQDLAGATNQTLTLNLTGNVIAPQTTLATPEPATWISASMAGLLGLGYRGLRRRKASV